MNKVFLIGNLTHDPESGSTDSGVAYCKFSIAVNRRFSKDNETDFFNVTAWRSTAENCSKYLAKGKKVAIAGSIQLRQYERDGVKKLAVDIIADEVEFLSPSGSDAATQTQGPAPQERPKDLTPVDDELPF